MKFYRKALKKEYRLQEIEIKFILLLEEHNKGNNDYLVCEKESGWKYLGLTNIESKRLQLLQK